MSYEHDFLNFCLSCDRSTTDGPYCSNACRLADCEKGGSPLLYSSSPAQSLHNHHSPSSSWSSSDSGAFLPPAVDFSSWGRKERPAASGSARESMSRSPSISSTQSTSSTTTTTTSGSSHTCTMSCMSESARKELRHYESLFDQTRHRNSYAPSRPS